MINNINIKEYLGDYINGEKQNLPVELRNISLNDWDVSNVTNMSRLFSRYSNFNEPLDNWNVSNVTHMSDMFNNCENFNQPLDSWNVSNVTHMSLMFYNCENFNQPLNSWNVSNVTDMSYMFSNCSNFNQPLDSWNVSNVTNMSSMFSDCSNFNQPLDSWNVSNVTDMSSMFKNCLSFNQPLNNWNVSNVTDMSYMFKNCLSFNQPLNNWNVSNVNNMSSMFKNCSIFNQPLNNWNVSNVTGMFNMFSNCSIFNQPLNNWNLNENAELDDMFLGATNYTYPPLRPERPATGRAFEIHNAFASLDINAIILFLQQEIQNNPSNNVNTEGNYNDNTLFLPLYNFIINKFPEDSENTNSDVITKQQYIDNLKNIYNNISTYLGARRPNENMSTVINFVIKQDDNFIDQYIRGFRDDCMNAYAGSANPQACLKGQYEYMFTAIGNVAENLCLDNPDCDEKYKILKQLFQKKTYSELTQEWSNTYLIDGEKESEFKGLTIPQRKQQFIDYMKNAFGGRLNQLWIDRINNDANEYESMGIFENRQFGGRKNKTKKSRKHNNMKNKTKKCKNKQKTRKYKNIRIKNLNIKNTRKQFKKMNK
jgi:surface protein